MAYDKICAYVWISAVIFTIVVWASSIVFLIAMVSGGQSIEDEADTAISEIRERNKIILPDEGN